MFWYIALIMEKYIGEKFLNPKIMYYNSFYDFKKLNPWKSYKKYYHMDFYWLKYFFYNRPGELA